MSAALGTLPFLATLWLVVVLGARILEESGAKIAAALKGEPLPILHVVASTRRTVPRRRDCPSSVSARPQWRAAA
jgi:hypothetical protein